MRIILISQLIKGSKEKFFILFFYLFFEDYLTPDYSDIGGAVGEADAVGCQASVPSLVCEGNVAELQHLRVLGGVQVSPLLGNHA